MVRYHTFNIVNISMIREVVTEQFPFISAVLTVLQLHAPSHKT